MATIQNFQDTPDKFKVQSICLKCGIKVQAETTINTQNTTVGTLIVATIYLQLIQNR